MGNGETKLTPRHWAIYRAVEERTMAGGEPITQKELAGIVGLPYNDRPSNSRDQSKGDHCREILDYVNEINESLEVDKIIVAWHYTYRLGTAEEVARHYAHIMQRIARMSVRAKHIREKAERNGQYKLLNNAGSPMQEGNEEYHAAYVGGSE